MGQANQRKDSDPYYGKFRRPSVRGLIISAPMKITGNNIDLKSSLDPQDLRFSLFFWDRLCWPTGRINIGSGDDASFLEKMGILHRPDYQIYGDGPEIVLGMQSSAFEELNKANPGGWAISQTENSVKTVSKSEYDAAGTMIELLSLVPIPKHDIPLQDILEFKSSRRPELLSFRNHLDEIIFEISSLEDSEAALISRRRDVESACDDLRRVAKEWQLPFYLSDYSATFNFDIVKAMAGATGGWKLGSEVSGVVGVAGSVLGALGSQVKVTAAPKFRPAKLPASPFAYAYRIQTEL